MAFRVEVGDHGVHLHLSGWDWMTTWTRNITIDPETIQAARVEPRGVLESKVQSRLAGIGTHDGTRRTGRRRVGAMMAFGVGNVQFWAVARSGPETPVLVLDVGANRWDITQLVLEVPDPQSAAAKIRTWLQDS